MGSKRSNVALAALVSCLALLLGGVAWISSMLLDLEAREAEARRQASEEENVRLALWRMDSAIAPILARESARPYFTYAAFYPAERPYTQMLAPARTGEALVPSPLVAEVPDRILLHFQLAPDGALTSPEAIEDRLLPLAARQSIDLSRVGASRARLAELAQKIERRTLSEALLASERRLAELAAEPPPTALAQANAKTPSAKSSFEWQMRSRSVQQASSYNANPYGQAQKQDANVAHAGEVGLDRRGEVAMVAYGDIREGPMTPLWVGDALLLVRRIQIGDDAWLQGCWLDWPALKKELVVSVADLLPSAALVPSSGRVNDPARAELRRLASLPVELVTGQVAAEVPRLGSTVQLLLAVAWVGVLLAAAAVVALVLGTLSLSERRGDFVSAVTHELRTPLTTFRMYSEMLADGMVKDAAKQKAYLDTLKREAVRLSHLVENVLAYARIERGRHTGKIEPLPVSTTIARIHERLADRALQAEMSLVVRAPEDPTLHVTADATALEQILFNLVDNACKYARGAANRTIELTIEDRGPKVALRVTDHGPGIAADVRRRLFQPFSKSAEKAAVSAPGVGLGLALSRRLARTMKGDLVLEPTRPGEGARFLLTLPRAP